MLKKYLFSQQILSFDACILMLRISTAALLFYKHGYEKITGFQEMLSTFPDPIGIGKLPGLSFAFLTDAICTLFIAVGVLSRMASLLILINLFVAFFFFHNGIVNDHGEAMILYLLIFLFLFLTGPGKYSIDAKFSGSDNSI